MTMNAELQLVEEKVDAKGRLFRFDVFKGAIDSESKVHKEKSVGSAILAEGCKTYSVYLKTFLNDVFYLLPEKTKESGKDFVILTRETSKNLNRKYFWNNVGTGVLLTNENSGLLKLNWDMLGVEDIYLNLYPRNPEGN